MKELLIREATLADLSAIQHMNQALCQKEHDDFDPLIDPNYPMSPKGESYFQWRIGKPDSLVLVAEENSEIAGYFIGALMDVTEDYRTVQRLAEAENMFVKEDFRSRGIGAQFIQKFEEWCRAKNVQVMRIEASAANNRAIEFYKKQGLKEVSLVLEKNLE